ncbi:MAG: glycosyltransferase family 4 protein, partial [Anaerolineales bacterium]
TIPMVGGGLRIVANLKAARALYKVMIREKYDIVHCWSSIAGFVGRLAADWAGVPLTIYSPEGFAFNEFINPWKRQMYILAERILGNFTDVLITCSETEWQQALEARVVTPGKLLLIENPLDTMSYDIRTIDTVAKRRELDLPDEAPIVGMVARLTAQKGPGFFVEAAARIFREMPQTHFVLVGDGELKTEIEALSTELGLDGSMHFLGNRDDYMTIIATFDVFVLSSLWEGMPYAPLEAMLLRRPIVATSNTGSQDLIKKDRTGVLVPPRDSLALARAVLELLREPARAARMGQRAEASVRQRFGIETAMDRIAQLYRDVSEITWQ